MLSWPRSRRNQPGDSTPPKAQKGQTMRKQSKISLRALIAAIVLFVAALPFGKYGWQKTTGGALFVLAVLAALVFLIAGIYSLATRARAAAR